MQGHSEKTSIVVVLADDLGYSDVEFNKLDTDKSGAKTTELNAMAMAESVVHMTNFHSASSVCSPTRSSLLSGGMPHKGCVFGPNADYDRPGRTYREQFPFRHGMTSIARNAKMAGYATAFFGKWHLGTMKDRALTTGSHPRATCPHTTLGALRRRPSVRPVAAQVRRMNVTLYEGAD